MHQLIKHDLFDIFKVNTLSFGTIGLTQADLVAMNEVIQSTGNSVLILLAVGYTIFKMVKIFKEMRQAEELHEKNMNDD